MELRGLKILVTGGAGFIGSHLVGKLLEQGSNIIAYDNFDSYYGDKIGNIRDKLRNPSYKLVKADILDYGTLKVTMKNVDVVFHLAAQPGVRYSVENPIKTNTVNTNGTLNVLRAAKENNVKKMIYSSSSSVYGNATELPMSENDPTVPISPYGASKLAAELYCRIYCRAYNMNVVILRYFTVYGPRQRPDMAIHKLTRMILNDQSPIIYGNGNQTRDFTYIKDIVDGTILAAQAEDMDGEVFNLGSGMSITVNQLVRELLKILRKEEMEPMHVQIFDNFDMEHTLADISKAERGLGFQPKTPLSEGLQKFVDWYLRASSTK